MTCTLPMLVLPIDEFPPYLQVYFFYIIMSYVCDKEETHGSLPESRASELDKELNRQLGFGNGFKAVRLTYDRR